MLSWDNISILAKCDLKKKNQVPIYIYSLRYISNMFPNTLYPIYARKSQKLIEDNQRNYKIIHPLKYHTTRPSVHDIKCNNIMRSRQLRMKQFIAKTSHTRNSCSQIYMARSWHRNNYLIWSQMSLWLLVRYWKYSPYYILSPSRYLNPFLSYSLSTSCCSSYISFSTTIWV